jgi:general secretion pathway protein F
VSARAAYRYRALRSDGGVESGEIDAERRETAADLLVRRGLLPVAIESTAPTRTRRRAMPWADLALGLRLLANLLQAGLSMDRALHAFAGCAPEAWRRVLPRITERVRQGHMLGDAMSDDEAGIPSLVAALVQAGEAGSGAATAVDRAAALAESVAVTRGAIHQALVYPAVLLAAGTLSLGFLVGVVLPRFAGILAELGTAPPTTTRIVLAGAAVARAGVVPLSFTAVIVAIIWRGWTATASGRRQWHQLLREVPGLGPARCAIATARASGAIGALLESGVALPRALRHGAAAAGDEAMADAILRAREAIVEGAAASAALGREKAFTSTALRLLRAGEETGRLGSMFTEAARIEHANAERLVRRSVQLIEPTFILLFGGLVALVAAALLQALYGVRPV